MNIQVSRLQAGVLLCSSLFTYSIVAQAQCEKPVGHFASLQSTVDIQRSNASEWQSARLSDKLCEGDTIRVGKNSRAALQLENDAVLRLDQNTTMRLISVSKDPEKRSFLEAVKGVFQSFTRKPHHLAVQTPYLNGLIDGTEFLVKVDADQSSILLLEGKIVAKNDQGTVTILPGQAAVASKGAAPKTVLVAKPLDAVQWTLHYPALLKMDAADYAADTGWQAAVKQSIEAYNAGDLQKAFSSIADVKGDIKDSRFYDYRASLLLTVGRVDDARKDLQQALSLSTKDSDALALQSIIAVAQNESDKAQDSAVQAVKAAPNSASAYIALSYAEQAKFNLTGARAALEKAVQLEPRNALAWARLAEIYSSFHQVELSTVSAVKAVSLNPNLSRTQTVLGFISLTEVDTAGASAAFAKAIALDQTDPLPHLGLGLAKIAEGDLHGGQREIDVAAILDPNQAIIRSYLGKAYYEEKRDELAAQQFDIAKKLDPKDPTPWFYDAIAKQTQNQPVEALHSMDQAIALNDNRAVYRSRLLLDSDLAARSTSQARIYSDLGFQPLALEEGWQSVNTDPTNYSAHRFLADSYSALPNHEIARVSELLQAQLLQPLNLSPIQPQSADSKLFLISSSGPGTASFNEYNPLFYRDNSALQFSALSAGNNTLSQEAVVSGVNKNVAFSFGGYHFQTDGFRPNADQQDDLANAFIQVQVSPETSVQAELRYKKANYGDLQLRFFPNDYSQAQDNNEITRQLRIGLRHDLSTSSTLLGSFSYQKTIFSGHEVAGGATIDGLKPENNTTGELQYLFRGNSYNLITGIGHFNRNGTQTATLNAQLPVLINPGPPPIFIFVPITLTSDSSLDQKHSNAYAYSNIHVSPKLTMTLGLSADFTENAGNSAEQTINDRDQYNPKFGLMWRPEKNTLVRLAAFRATKRTLVADQSLEPTQVAGFNQFYDDSNHTVSRRYGAAIDHTFSPSLYGGLELSRRDLDVPINGDPIPTPSISEWRNEEDRAYLFWTPLQWLALSAEYQYEDITHDFVDTEGVNNLKTDRLLLGMKFFSPSGWNFSLNPTYYNQSGSFDRTAFGGSTNETGKDNFWVVDAALSYRLPKRHGFISAGVKNMFKQDFMYFDTNANNPTVQPGRTFFTNATLTLP